MIGLLIFLIMNAGIMIFVYHYHFQTELSYVKGLTLGFFAGHVGMLVHAVTMSNFYTIMNMELFWFALALICVFYYNESVSEATDSECRSDAGSEPELQLEHNKL